MTTLIQFENKKGEFIQIKTTLVVNEGDYIRVYRGKCDCSKDSCDCVQEQRIHKDKVIGTLKV